MPVTPIHIVAGNVAPRYEQHHEAELAHVTITEQGTAARLPIVDVVCRVNGQQAVLTLTGRQVFAIAAALRGVNLRNHGVPEP